VRCGAVAVAVAVVYSVTGSGAPSGAVAKGSFASMPRAPTEIESRLTWRHLGCVGHRQSKPRSVQGPRRAPTRMTVPYGWGRGACKLGPQPSSCARVHASLTMTAGTLCRDARGLSSEQKERLALRMLAPKRVLAVPHLHSSSARARVGVRERVALLVLGDCGGRFPCCLRTRGGRVQTWRRHSVWGALDSGRAGRAKDVR